MSDLIDRQDAIDEILDLTGFASIIELFEDVEEHDYLRDKRLGGINDAIDAVLMVATAQPETKWIQCSERMPEEKDAGILKKLGIEKRSEYVLVTIEDNGQRVTGTACTYDGKWDWDMKYAFPDFKVVAWMPLPEPYKGDEP